MDSKITLRFKNESGIARGGAVLAVAAVLVAVAGVVYWQRPTSPAAASHVYDDRVANPNKTFDISLDGEKLVSGTPDVVVNKNDSVRLNITAAGANEVAAKLDGYDITTESDSDGPGGFSFIADRTGTFSYYALGEANPDGVTPRDQVKIGTITVK